MDEIFMEYEDLKFGNVPREPAESDPEYVKHVHCEGARFHVLWYDTNGKHCSEKDCIINRKVKEG